jgi:hypothetical protein
MELILIVAALLLLDILAMRFGVDSRILDVRDYQPQMAYVAPVPMPLDTSRTSLRVRVADGLRALAVRIEPAACAPGRTPARHAMST